MKRLSLALALVASLAVAGTVSAAPSKLRTAVGRGGQAFVLSATSARLTSVPGGWASAYLAGKGPAGKRLADVDMGFTAVDSASSGLVSSGVVGGAPRLTVNVDFDGDGVPNAFATIDWASCGGTVDGSSDLTASVFVSTTSPTCRVNLSTGGSYPNWDAFAADRPAYRIAKAEGQPVFIIVDGWADVTLTGIDLN